MFSWHTPVLGARFIQREIVRSEMSNSSISSSPRIRASMRILPIGCLLGSGQHLQVVDSPSSLSYHRAAIFS